MNARTLFPQPTVSVAAFITWLLAQNALTAGNLLLGAILALAIPHFTAKFWPDYPDRVRYRPLLRLLGRVLLDIVIANVRVAVLVLGPQQRLKPHFIVIPLAVERSHSITLLASVISLTPGTVSANLSGDRRSLLVHGLAIDDPARAVAQIKERYESQVKEAFEC